MNEGKWCVVSGNTTHLFNAVSSKIVEHRRDKLNLMKSASAEIIAEGLAALITNVGGSTRNIFIGDVLYVCDVRSNENN